MTANKYIQKYSKAEEYHHAFLLFTGSRYFKVWKQFLTDHIQSLLTTMGLKWDTTVPPHYYTCFHYSTDDGNLYYSKDNSYLCHKALQKHNTTRRNISHLEPLPKTLNEVCITSLRPVEVMHTSKHIQI